MSKKTSVVWPAEPHTLAKITILKGYLSAWLRILGMRCRGQTILYVDGFAGPGRYSNHDEGSPLGALREAQKAIVDLGPKFIASEIHGAFIERDRKTFDVLCQTIAPFESNPSLGITKLCCEFADGIKQLRDRVPAPFRGEGPLFVFADPFGGTGIPFRTFAECMQASTAELLVNLDADGIARIFLGDSNNRREEQLTELFGNESWRQSLTGGRDLRRLSVQILDLYKQRLRTLPDVRFVWSFAMRGKQDMLNYHLVFATKHPLGMEKMKEAMRAIDQSGSYSFSDAHADQHTLFRDDDAEVYAEALFQKFDGKSISWAQAHEFALSETPFLNPKAMLLVLEQKRRLQVDPVAGQSRRAGTFPEDKVLALRIGQFGPTNVQTELF